MNMSHIKKRLSLVLHFLQTLYQLFKIAIKQSEPSHNSNISFIVYQQNLQILETDYAIHKIFCLVLFSILKLVSFTLVSKHAFSFRITNMIKRRENKRAYYIHCLHYANTTS